MSGDIFFSNRVTRLRTMRESDAPEVVRLTSDPEVIRYTLFPQVAEEEVRAWIRDKQPGRYRWWGIEEAGRLAGFCGLVLEPQYESAEAWYLLDKPYWGRGIGTETARDVVEMGFTGFQMHRVWAHVCPENVASVRILEKIGMRREGFIRKNLKIQGEWHDSYLYAVLREEWTAKR